MRNQNNSKLCTNPVTFSHYTLIQPEIKVINHMLVFRSKQLSIEKQHHQQVMNSMLNSMVGDYLHAIGSKVTQEFRELTKAAPLPSESPGLLEMVQQISAMTPVKRKLEMHEEEVDNPSPDKKSKKTLVQVKAGVAEWWWFSPDKKSKKVRIHSIETRPDYSLLQYFIFD